LELAASNLSPRTADELAGRIPVLLDLIEHDLSTRR
jgi:hypothetical protein